MRQKFPRVLAASALALLLGAGVSLPAAAAPASFDSVDGGLVEFERIVGPITWSSDGMGANNGGNTGSLTVRKPAGSTVRAAYLMAASLSGIERPVDVTLSETPVVFTHSAINTQSGFVNFFADVTALVAPIVDAAAVGDIELAANQGANSGTDGVALVVVFDTPAAPSSTFVLFFGTAANGGDTFELFFDSLRQPDPDDLQMSLGISFSYGSEQYSTVSVNDQLLTDQAGHTDDCTTFLVTDCGNGSLLTVGGVGDSLANPVAPRVDSWSQTGDDELYSLAPFVTVGDTRLDVTTNNPSNDDNIFMAAFFLNKVSALAAEPEPSPEVIAAPPELAATGAALPEPLAAGAASLGLLLLGGLALDYARRRNRSEAASI